MTNVLRKIYDHRLPDSFASNLRKKRFNLFTSLLNSVPSPINILDVGGTVSFWENTGFPSLEIKDVQVTLLNVSFTETSHHPKIKQVVGDATNMVDFKSNEFDIVFSNSVIEHVGDYDKQRQMAAEVMRVGKRYFVQTPNLYFPIEPHFVFPFFQFLPISVRAWLVHNFALGMCNKMVKKEVALRVVQSIRLLDKKEFINIFPGAQVYEEKLLGLTKSLIAYGEKTT